MRTCVLNGLGLMVVACAAVHADVHFFVSNPTGNSVDFNGHAAGRGLVMDTSVRFELHPEGELVPGFFAAASGVTVTGTGALSVQTGPGSQAGNISNPNGIGEGVLLPEPTRYLHTGFGGVTTVDFAFDAPVAAVGFMTADMFQWGASMPNATIQAFDGAGVLLGSRAAVNTSFEFDFLYFMGVADDAARISRVRFTNFGIAGDSIYVTHAVIGRCGADFNGDGAINSQDFFDFLGAFFAQHPSSDFNRDTVVNSQDFFDFLGAFFAGC